MSRVLILDDESMVLDMLVVRLSAPGIHLTTCREIEAAEALLSCLRFDVVITDLSVSELGGLEGTTPARAPVAEKRGQARLQGFTGEACGECGNFTLVRNGTCLKCDTCGATTGCS